MYVSRRGHLFSFLLTVDSVARMFVLQVAAAKPSAALICMVVAAWSFLLTTIDERALNPKIWQELVFINCNLFLT